MELIFLQRKAVIGRLTENLEASNWLFLVYGY